MKANKTLYLIFLSLLCLSAPVSRLLGQVSISALGTSYTEDFNTLASTSTSTVVPTNWNFLEVGSNANTVYTAGTGSSTTGDTYSFGVTSNPERAWGALNSNSLDTVWFGAQYTNNTGSTITDLKVTYTGEQWRKVTNRLIPDTIYFLYSTNATGLGILNGTWNSVPQLQFLTPAANYGSTVTSGALNGNLTANSQTLTYTLTGLSIANGQSIWLAWIDENITGSDDGMAIDDVNIVACAGTPSSSISGNANICVGASTNLSVTYTGGQPWSFTWTDGTTPVNVTGITTSPYTFSVTPANTTTYTISNVTGPCGVPNIGTASAVVNVSTVAGTAAISANQTICSTASTNLTYTLTGVSPWQITWTDGTTPVTTTGITGSPYTVSITPNSTTTYTLTATTDGCGAGTISGSGVSIITVDPSTPPTATLSGNNSICTGTSAQLSVALANGNPWSFTYTDGTTPLTVTGITGSPALLSVTPTANTTYSMVSVSNSVCNGSASGTADITVWTLPTASISGSQSICAGATAQLSVTLTGTSPWAVTYTEGTTAVTTTGVTSNPYFFTVTPGATTTYSLSNITDAHCNQSASGDAIVSVEGLPSASISGTQSLCSGNSAQLSIALTGASPWDVTWSDGAAVTTVTGITASPYLVNLTPGASVTYTLTGVQNGCTGSITGSPAALTLNTPPSATISGSSTICSGSAATLTVTLLSSLTTYDITYTDGSTPVTLTGLFTSPYLINLTPSASVTYSLTSVSDPGGCPGTVLGNAILSVLPTVSASLSGDQTLCAGTSGNLTLSLGGSTPWNVVYTNGTNNITLNGITASPFQISVTPGATTTYSLVSVTGANCSGIFNGDPVVTVNPVPAPVITGSQTLVISGVTGTATYQWQLNGTDISGATGATYNPTANGTYSVVVTQNGCSGASNSLNVVLTSLEENVNSGIPVTLYPNPAHEWLQIDAETEITRIEWLTITGQQLTVFNPGRSSSFRMNISGFPSGLYLIKVETEKGTGLRKVWVNP